MKEVKKLVKILIDFTKEKSDQEKEKLLKDFLLILKEKRKFYLAKKILKELKKDEKKRELILTLARKFDNETLEKIKEKLKEIFGKEKEIKIKIDEKKIGGFLAKNENYLIDATIEGILRKLLWKFIRF